MSERGRAADGEAGGGADLLGGGPGVDGARHGGQLRPGRPGAVPRSARAPAGLGDEHERLHDLRDVASDRAGGVLGGLRPLGEPLGHRGRARAAARLDEPVGRVAHGVTPRATSARAPRRRARRDRRVSARARSSPTRRRAIARPGAVRARRPAPTATIATGTRRARRRARTPADDLPRSDVASNAPSPVTTRSASPSASSTRRRRRPPRPRGAAGHRRTRAVRTRGRRPRRHPARGSGRRRDHARRPRPDAQGAVELPDVLGGALLRPVRGARAGRPAERVVDVGEPASVHGRRAAGRCQRARSAPAERARLPLRGSLRPRHRGTGSRGPTPSPRRRRSSPIRRGPRAADRRPRRATLPSARRCRGSSFDRDLGAPASAAGARGARHLDDDRCHLARPQAHPRGPHPARSPSERRGGIPRAKGRHRA